MPTMTELAGADAACDAKAPLLDKIESECG